MKQKTKILSKIAVLTTAVTILTTTLPISTMAAPNIVPTTTAKIEISTSAPEKQEYSVSEQNKISEAADAIASTLKDFNTSVDLSGYDLSKSEAEDAVSVMLNRHPEIFYVEDAEVKLDQNTGNALKMSMAIRPDAIEEAHKLEDKTREILAGISPEWNDLEKLLYLHDWMCDNIEYSDQLTDSITCYEAIVRGKALWEGYAKAYVYLGQMCGIDVQYILYFDHVLSDEVAITGYAWNSIKLNEKTYYADIAWDDVCAQGSPRHQYLFLASSQDKMVKWGHGDIYWVEFDNGFLTPVSGLYNDKTYDDVPWLAQNASIIQHNSGFLSLNPENHCIYEYHPDDTYDVYATIPEDLYFDTIAELDGVLYASTWYSIFKHDANNNTWNEICTLDQFKSNPDSEQWIEGVNIINNELNCVIANPIPDQPATMENHPLGIVSTSEELKLDQTNVLLEGLDQTAQIKVTNTTSPITWSSDNTSVATVDQNGIVTSTGYGRAYITASCDDKTARCLIMVDTTWQSSYDILYADNPPYIMITDYHGNETNINITEPIYYLGNQCKTIISNYYQSEPPYYKIKDKLKSFTLNNSNYIINGSEFFESFPAITDVNILNTQITHRCQSMFANCKALKSVSISNTDLSRINNTTLMFAKCGNLESLDIDWSTTGDIESIYGMFKGCKSLKTIDLSTMNLSKLENQDKANIGLSGCSSLITIYTPTNLQYKIDLPGIFLDENGTKYTSLPTNRSDSIKLTKKGAKPEDPTDPSDPTEDIRTILNNITVNATPKAKKINLKFDCDLSNVTYEIKVKESGKKCQTYTTTNNTYIIKKLQPKTKYKIKVRGKTTVDGVNYVGKWKTVSVKTK